MRMTWCVVMYVCVAGVLCMRACVYECIRMSVHHVCSYYYIYDCVVLLCACIAYI